MPLHGTIDCSHPIETFSYQSSCRFSCEEGYTLTGSSLLMCDVSGQWNDSQPNCEGKKRLEVNNVSKSHCGNNKTSFAKEFNAVTLC